MSASASPNANSAPYIATTIQKPSATLFPATPPFYRVLRLIDPAHMEAIIARWLLEQDIAQLQRLAVDGKVLRGTGREDGKPLALLSVNGTHRVRDVSMGEDACRIAHPKAARNMVTLRNLAIGLYNRLRVGEKTQAPSLPAWRRSMKLNAALRHILR
jgi:hypothetical protein